MEAATESCQSLYFRYDPYLCRCLSEDDRQAMMMVLVETTVVADPEEALEVVHPEEVKVVEPLNQTKCLVSHVAPKVATNPNQEADLVHEDRHFPPNRLRSYLCQTSQEVLDDSEQIAPSHHPRK